MDTFEEFLDELRQGFRDEVQEEDLPGDEKEEDIDDDKEDDDPDVDESDE